MGQKLGAYFSGVSGMSEQMARVFHNIFSSWLPNAVMTFTNKTLVSPTISGTGAIAGTFTGNVTGNVTGNLTGQVTGSVTGNLNGLANRVGIGGTAPAPSNAAAASGTVTFIDGSTQGETVTIGDDTYEVDIDAAGVTEGNIPIALTSGGGTAKETVATALTSAITASATADVLPTDNSDGTVTITSGTKGVIGNSIALTEVGDHVSVSGAGVLTGGANGTVGLAGEIKYTATHLWICTEANTIADANWVSIAFDA